MHRSRKNTRVDANLDASQSGILTSPDNNIAKCRLSRIRMSSCVILRFVDRSLRCATVFIKGNVPYKSAHHIVCNLSAICHALIAARRKKPVIIRHAVAKYVEFMKLRLLRIEKEICRDWRDSWKRIKKIKQLSCLRFLFLPIIFLASVLCNVLFLNNEIYTCTSLFVHVGDYITEHDELN